MCSIVSGDGFPLNRAMVTLSFPMATPSSNSNCLFNPNARANHFALFFGSRTANPKWPTPSVNDFHFPRFIAGIVDFNLSILRCSQA